jgi:hypothetical protein
VSRTKRDPLIAAMIAKLPDGDEWPVDRQLAWLHLMAMAFGTVYGGDAAARLVQVPSTPTATPVPDRYHEALRLFDKWIEPPPTTPVEAKPQWKFYVDEEGNARNKHGQLINAKDVTSELVDLRGQDGDVRSIRWADGSTGLNGADLTIVAV